ncbi:hypothetical protein ACJJI3_03065 [Microbulbifer sp. ZKSA004]|uniref:hypothetical protein n=1 Tax=Microbulbifer sp. ZKSA004 TaxID=3243389 RepID=UPI0040399771
MQRSWIVKRLCFDPITSTTARIKMRLLMKLLIPAKAGNKSIADDSMSVAMNDFIASANPEASYFFLEQGKRAAIFIFEENCQDQLMTYNEKFFAAFDAEIWITPTLNLKELQLNL